jgi:predicted O-linked N-acetylglucosamine transferase (SPINDLY family)
LPLTELSFGFSHSALNCRYVDYHVVDKVVAPPEYASHHRRERAAAACTSSDSSRSPLLQLCSWNSTHCRRSERLLVMAHHYQINDHAASYPLAPPAPRSQFGLPADAVVMCNFNSLYGSALSAVVIYNIY